MLYSIDQDKLEDDNIFKFLKKVDFCVFISLNILIR